MRKVISVFFVLQLVCLAFSRELPSNFKKCKRSDSDISACLKEAIAVALTLVPNGIPSLKVPVMEPLRIDEMTIGEGTGPVQVVQNYKNVDIYNMTKVTIVDTKAKVTDNDFFAEFDVYTDLLTFKADYSLNGKILVLPIVGDGPCTLELIKTNVKLTFTGSTIDKKGEKYMKIDEVKINLKPEKVGFNFENLFNGDKQLGDAMNKVLNENDLLVFADVQSGYEEFLAIVVKNIANKFFEYVPYKDLVPA